MQIIPVPLWSIIVAIVVILYLVITDIRLHRRVVRLEAIVRRLEGANHREDADNTRGGWNT